MGQAASQMAASGGCIRLYACILKQHALLEQMIVECIKATPDEALSEGCMTGATVDRRGDIKID